MDTIRAVMSQDRFARLAGVELLDVSPGFARTRMAVTDEHRNGLGLVHGAAIFTLADVAFAAACNAYGTVAVAINVSISFVAAASGGALTAEARETSRNPRLGTYSVEVRDESGDLVATFHGMAYRKKDPLPAPGGPPPPPLAQASRNF